MEQKVRGNRTREAEGREEGCQEMWDSTPQIFKESLGPVTAARK